MRRLVDATVQAMTSSKNSWASAAGVSLEFCATIFNATGKQCLRYAGTSDDYRFYVLGAILYIGLYGIMDAAAAAIAPQSLVISMDGMIVVWNILLAPFTLGEAVTTSRLTVAILVVVGTVGSGVFGSHSSTYNTGEEYVQALGSSTASAYYFFCVAVAIVCIALWRQCAPESKVGGLVRCGLAGWTAGLGNLMLKAALQFVKENAWSNGYIYLFGILFTVIQLSAVVMISLAMKLHEALFAIPIYEGALILSAALSGYLVLDEGRDSSNADRIMFWLSLCVSLGGLCLCIAWPDWLVDGEKEVACFAAWLRRPAPGGKNEATRLVDGSTSESAALSSAPPA